ncbi:nodulation protein NfeD [uncultured Desulfuromusa sp.]|uniref:NfeD family protein n=1 Tax=uncultured Desulfuromusa sp. TaxID=219183 RepID=UPI002AA9215A|nr:nodulation protein NfeD [uncultured Desulfuromusa sp.]
MCKLVFSILTAVFLIIGPPGHSGSAAQKEIRHLHIAASINPVTAAFISQQIAIANQQAEPAILIQIDTPGGLDSAMREIIQAELNSTIPVIVYIAPAGARAASAGALIALAADFAVMAPGTNIGAAHPVAIGPGKQADSTMMEKVENDAAAYARGLAQKRGRNQDWAEQAVRESVSISAEEAFELSVIDLIADNTDHLLTKLNNYKYIRDGKILVFTTQGMTLQQIDMNWRQKILNTLSNPNIAYLLMMLGIIGIFFEISQPGVILPGAIGAIAILLALFAFSSLPINYVGVLLIILAIVLFILEIKVVSYGMLAIGGIIAMTLGSLMLVDSSDPYLQISRALIAATVTVSAGFFLLATGMVIRTQRRPVTSGQEGMIGEIGIAIDPINSSGIVFVHGEYWQACSIQPLPAGTKIQIIKVMDGLKLQVEAIEPEEV